MASKLIKKPKCKYGSKCYRKNGSHIENYAHSSGDEQEDENTLSCSIDSENIDDENEDKEVFSKTFEIKPDTENLENIERIDLGQIKDTETLIDEYYQMKMPEDFFEFLAFCKSIKPNDPKNALDAAHIELAGVYDLVLFGFKFDYRIHSRFFYDPPEFQTILIVKNSQNLLHFGYFRDDPNEMPNFVAINEAKVDCKIHCKGDNLFCAVNWYLEELISGRNYKSKYKLDEIKELKAKLVQWVDEHHKDGRIFSLQLKTPKIKAREKKINCKTFHQAGICVPVDSKGFGYRDVPESYDKQKKLFENYCLKEDPTNKSKKEKASERIQEIITLIQFANDECDYGMGIEFGINMFCFGDLSLHKFIKSTLSVCYQLLCRDLYGEIIIEHLKTRKSKS